MENKNLQVAFSNQIQAFEFNYGKALLALLITIFRLVVDFAKVHTKKFAVILLVIIAVVSAIVRWVLPSKEELTEQVLREVVLDVIQSAHYDTMAYSVPVSQALLFGRKNTEVKQCAPVEVDDAAPSIDLKEPDANAYVRRFCVVAQQEMRKYGIPASISLAQGLIESRSGTSTLAVQNNNHFGIKCFSKSCRRGHCTNMKDDTHKDFFRKFNTPWESWREHSKLLSGSRYKRLKKCKDYRSYAYGLKACGYATDRTYAEKLIGIIERYELYRYDK